MEEILGTIIKYIANENGHSGYIIFIIIILVGFYLLKKLKIIVVILIKNNFKFFLKYRNHQ